MKEYTGPEADYYDSCFSGLEGDLQFYVEEAQKAGPPVLELGCGTGRILLPIAKAGLNIVGLDRAPAMLALLRQKLAKLGPDVQGRVSLIEGDMRDFAFADRFPLIIIPYRAFLHLLTAKAQRQALTCIREHLTDDGRLIFNVFDPNLEVIAAHLGPLGAAQKKDFEFVDPTSGHRIVVWATSQYDPEQQLIEQYFIFEELDADGDMIARTYRPLTLRYVHRYEMRYLLELCGYKVEALYGDFQCGPFRYGGEQVWVARKA
jgi:SAM-dependent methyltransferase